ncbi:hypothetical protein PIB30_077317 [Stylosanthes scabra]|uniref:Uncharacterized protein n=1 Tax=Stylosanthes scabra TaxID=79078 RepID=A0ABU6ZP70_9FABA|nr:hypothetical protein [Stylosanthes scabra]
MEEIAMIQKRFGDEQSTLLDQFERLSFEAILKRSISEPGLPRSLSSSVSSHSSSSSKFFTVAPTTSIPLVTHQVKQGQGRGGRGRGRGRGQGSAFHRVLKKLFRPFVIGRKNNHNVNGANNKHAPDPRNPISWKKFSRSLRYVMLSGGLDADPNPITLQQTGPAVGPASDVAGEEPNGIDVDPIRSQREWKPPYWLRTTICEGGNECTTKNVTRVS